MLPFSLSLPPENQSKYRICITFYPSPSPSPSVYVLTPFFEHVFMCVNETILMLIAFNSDLMLFTVFYLIKSIAQLFARIHSIDIQYSSK